MTDSKEVLLDEIRAFVEAHPYEVFGDYRDELTVEQASALLESREKFDEIWWEVELNASDYADWSELQREVVEQFGERIMAAFPDDFAKNDEADDLEWRDMPEEVQEAFFESTVVDCSDLLQTCLKNCDLNIVAVPLKRNGEEIHPPHWEVGKEEYRKRARYVRDAFDMDVDRIESCYEHESLKVMGRLDWREVYEKGRPVAVTITPQDQLIFHTAWNGSGCLGDVIIRKTKTMPARFVIDESYKYGVQSVYGFVGEVWRNQIEVAKWEAWD